MSDESRAIAIPTPGLSLVPEWWARAYGPTTMYVTSLDVTKQEGRATLLSCLNEDSESKDEHLNTDLRIVNYVLTPASKVEDGELREWVRCTLVLDDGRRVAFGSLGIIKSLMLIQQLDRPAPWNPPLVKRLKLSKLSNGGNWLTLVDPPASGKPAAKGK